ncbi:MAG: hypothetical protein HQL52_03000, partial [Magnetococcales bacterium]|nr:hypothetical protein [Magnetococcales bacterium]
MGRSSFFSTLVSALWTLTLISVSVYAGYYVALILDWSIVQSYITLPGFLSVPLEYQTETPIIRTLAGVISGFLLFFIICYVWQAFWDAFRLGMVSRSLRVAMKKGRLENPERPVIDWGWFYYPLFSRLWRDFAETLHCQRHPDAKVDENRVQYRATAPAELHFSPQTLVDTPMKVEFFRHLPGILTGAGIVSTFAGILLGLTEFNPVVEPDQVTLQLQNLFMGVSTAFVASFFAIFTAICITVVEKLLLHWRYAQVTALQGRLDDMFQAGVEPEYLAELVKSGSEQSDRLEALATQFVPRLTAFLERSGESDALQGGALDKILDPLAEKLAASQANQTRALAEKLAENQANQTRALAEALKNGLNEPLKLISKSVQVTLEEQRKGGESIDALKSGLEGVGEKLDRIVGAVNGLDGVLRDGHNDHAQRMAREAEATGQRADEQARHLKEGLQGLGERFETVGDRLQGAIAGLQQNGEGIQQLLEKQTNQLAQGEERDQEQALKQARAQEQAQEQAQALTQGLEGLSQKLDEGVAAVKEISGSVDKTMGGLSSSLNETMTGISSSLNKELGALSSSLNETMTGISSSLDETMTGLSSSLNEQTGGLSSSLNETMTGLSSSLNKEMGGMTDSLTKGFDTLGGQLNQAAEGVSAVGGKLTGLLEKQSSQLTAQLADQAAQAGDGEQARADRMTQGLEALGEKLDQAIEGIAAFSQMGSQLKEVLEEQSQALAQGTQGEREQGLEVIGALQSLGEKLDQAGQGLAGLDGAVGEISNRLKSGLDTLRQGIDGQGQGIEGINQGIAGISQGIEGVNQGIHGFGQKVESSVAGVSRVGGELRGLLQHQAELLEKNIAGEQERAAGERERGDMLILGIEELGEKVNGAVSGISDALKGGVGDLKSQLAQSHAGIDGLGEVLQGVLASQTARQEVEGTEQQAQSERVSIALDGLGSRLDQIGQQLDGAASGISAGLTSELQALGGKLDQAVSGASDISDVGLEIQNILESQASLLTESAERDKETAQRQGQGLESIGERMDGALSVVAKALDGGFKELGDKVDLGVAGIADLGAGLTGSLAKQATELSQQTSRLNDSAQKGQEGLAAVAEKLQGLGDKLDGGINALADAGGELKGLMEDQSALMVDAAQQERHLSQTLNTALDGIGEKLADSLALLRRELGERGERLDRVLDAIPTTLTTGSQQVKKALESGLVAIPQLVENLEALRQEQGERALILRQDQDARDKALRQDQDARDKALRQEQDSRSQAERSLLESALTTNRLSLEKGVAALHDKLHEVAQKLPSGSDIQSLMKELSQAQQQADKERDAFLLNRLSAGQGELIERVEKSFNAGQGALVERVKESFDAGLEQPVQEIVERVSEVREAQLAQGRELSEGILNAFAHQLRETVSSLGDRLGELGERITSEREGMEATFKNLVVAMGEAAEQGGEKLSSQLDRALAGSELRQDELIESLTKFTADIRVDLDQLQVKIRDTSQELSDNLVSQTQEISAQTGEATEQRIEASTSQLSREFKATLQKLEQEQAQREKSREKDLMARLQAGDDDLAKRLVTAIQSDLAGSADGLAERLQSAIQKDLSSSTDGLAERLQSAIQKDLSSSTDGLAERL